MEEQQTQSRRRTIDNPEFVIKNQAVSSSSETSPDGEVTKLTNIIEVIRSAGPDGKKDSLPGASVDAPSPSKPRQSDEVSVSSTAPTQASQSTKDRLYSHPEGSFFNLAMFLPSRLLGTASKAATIGSDTPRTEDMDDLDAEPEHFAGDLSQSLSLDEFSYYVFDRSSRDVAHYLYQNPDQSSRSDATYLIDRVPLKVFTLDTGETVYQVKASKKDQTSIGHDICGKDRLSGMGVTSDQEARDDGLADSQTTESALIHELSDDEQGGIQRSIISKVIDRLRVRRHMQDHVNVVDESGEYIQGTQGMYLVNDQDIHKIVKAVINEIESGEEIHELEDDIFCKGSSTLAKPRLNEAAHAILPPAATIAEPATTISVPKTSFTSVRPSDEQIYTKTHSNDSNVTMIVSRRSIAEITWTSRTPSGDMSDQTAIIDDQRPLSQCNSPTHRASTVYSTERHQSQPSFTTSGFSVHHYTTPHSLKDILADVSRSRSSTSTRQTSSGTAITSFPKLPSRACTNDWLNPPLRTEELQRSSSTLYQQGVDAHCGVEEAEIDSSPLEEPLKSDPYDQQRFYRNPFSKRSDESENEMSEIASLLLAEKKLGAAIGISSRQHRTSHNADSQIISSNSNETIRPSWMDKIRQGSHKLFHRHESPKSSDKAVVTTAPRLDKSGTYQAMTGSKLVVNRQRQNTCSEDDRPHIYEDDVARPLLSAVV